MKNKMKSRKAFGKRIKVTGSGKAKFKRAGKRHQLGHRKSAARKLALRAGSYLDPADMGFVAPCLPYGSHR